MERVVGVTEGRYARTLILTNRNRCEWQLHRNCSNVRFQSQHQMAKILNELMISRKLSKQPLTMIPQVHVWIKQVTDLIGLF